tara:strand:- start:15875 stop:16216 length:342 start_codon:yes stop_codon:yes gene_type:complete
MSLPESQELSFGFIRRQLWFLVILGSVYGGGLSLMFTVSSLAEAQEKVVATFKEHATQPTHQGSIALQATLSMGLANLNKRVEKIENGQDTILLQNAEMLRELKAMRAEGNSR